MESALPILLFLGFLFGSTILVLVCGMYGQVEEESAPEADRSAALGLATAPRIFGRPGQAALENPVTVVVDESLVSQVEVFLCRELDLAEVSLGDELSEPLHGAMQAEEAAPSMFERLELYIRNEQQVVASFLSDPSVESLYGSLDPEAVPA